MSESDLQRIVEQYRTGSASSQQLQNDIAEGVRRGIQSTWTVEQHLEYAGQKAWAIWHLFVVIFWLLVGFMSISFLPEPILTPVVKVVKWLFVDDGLLTLVALAFPLAIVIYSFIKLVAFVRAVTHGVRRFVNRLRGRPTFF